MDLGEALAPLARNAQMIVFSISSLHAKPAKIQNAFYVTRITADVLLTSKRNAVQALALRKENTMTNLLAGIIGAFVGAGVGVFALAMAKAGKTEEPPRECVMEEIPDLLFFIYRCSECGKYIVHEETMKDFWWKFCPNCGAKIAGVKKDMEEDDETVI